MLLYSFSIIMMFQIVGLGSKYIEKIFFSDIY